MFFLHQGLDFIFLKATNFRIDDLEEMKKALTILKSEIGFSSVPLFEAMLNISLRTTGIVSDIFSDASEKYMNRVGENGFEIWENAIKKKSIKVTFCTGRYRSIPIIWKNSRLCGQGSPNG